MKRKIYFWCTWLSLLAITAGICYAKRPTISLELAGTMVLSGLLGWYDYRVWKVNKDNETPLP